MSRATRWMWPSARSCSIGADPRNRASRGTVRRRLSLLLLFTDTLLRHSEANVKERIAERKLGNDSLVVELASNDGYLLQYYRSAGSPCWASIRHRDRSPPPAKRVSAPARVLRPATCTVARLERPARRYDPRQQRVGACRGYQRLRPGIATSLKDDGVAVIECPYVKDLIEHGEFDTIYHEHLCYFSVTALRDLFRRHGLFIARVVPLAIHGGSLRVFVEKQNRPEQSVHDYIESEQRLGLDRIDYYADFSNRVNQIRTELNDFCRDSRSARPVSSATARQPRARSCSTTWHRAGTLDFVVDRNTHKQGRYIPGVRLPIAVAGESPGRTARRRARFCPGTSKTRSWPNRRNIAVAAASSLCPCRARPLFEQEKLECRKYRQRSAEPLPAARPSQRHHHTALSGMWRHRVGILLWFAMPAGAQSPVVADTQGGVGLSARRPRARLLP